MDRFLHLPLEKMEELKGWGLVYCLDSYCGAPEVSETLIESPGDDYF